MNRFATAVSVLIALGATVLPQVAAGAEQQDPPGNATPLKAAELYAIYGGKSWNWGTDRAARFSVDGRAFTAVLTESWGIQYAEGRWRISDKGQLCILADWVSSYGRVPATSCFQHVEKDGVIYQRTLPNGKWEVFKHAKRQAEDGINALVPQDLVSGRLPDAKVAVKAAAGSIK